MSALTDRFRQMSLPADEIIEDIEQHFSEGKENGLTEQEICEKLGSPEEIAEAYIQDNGCEIPQSVINTVNDCGNITYNREAAPKASAGLITAALCLDIFVYSWAIPTLLVLVIAYIAVAFALVVSGAVNMVIAVKSTVYAVILTVISNIERSKQVHCITKMFTCLILCFLCHFFKKRFCSW